MQETHPLRVFPDGGDEHVTSNLKVDSSGSRRTQTGIIFKHRDPGRARTVDLEIRSHMLYPAELRGQTRVSLAVGV